MIMRLFQYVGAVLRRCSKTSWLLLLAITAIFFFLAVNMFAKDYKQGKVMRYLTHVLGILPGNNMPILGNDTIRSNADPALVLQGQLKLRSIFGFDFLPPQSLGQVITMADFMRKQNKGRPLLVAFVNNAFVPFTLNWLCHTKHMDIQQDVLLIAVDQFAKTNLLKVWPEVQVVSLGINMHKDGQKFGKAGYMKILVVRAAILSALVSSGIEIVHFETDALWLQNPMPDLLSHENYDVIAQTCYKFDHYPLGFLYLNNTQATKNVISNMTTQLAKVEKKIRSANQQKTVSEAEMDQPILSRLIKSDTAIRKMRMDYSKYPDGMWYSSDKVRINSPRPLMIQNNWIISVESKLARFKQWKHWFLRNDSTCDENLVKDIVYDFP